MASHLGQAVKNHVTLELVGGIKGGFGPESLGWVRVVPNGGIQAGPGGGNYVVPKGLHLVITDVDWQYDDHSRKNAGAAVTLRLFVWGSTDNDRRRLLESTIVLSAAGQGGTNTTWTAGGVFGPGTRIGIDTSPLTTKNRLQHALLHGYLIGSSR